MELYLLESRNNTMPTDRATVHRPARNAEYQRQMARRAVLRTMASALASAHDATFALQLGVDTAVDALAASAGAAYLADAAGTLRLAAARSLPDEVQSRLGAIGQQSEPFARALASRDAVLVSKSSFGPTTVGPFATLSSSALVVAPILPATSPQGALVLLKNAGRPFTPNDVLVAMAIAAQLALCLDALAREQEAGRSAAELERQRLARDLHDSAVQLLHGVTMFAESGRRAIAAGETAEAGRALDRVVALGQQALAELRILVYGMLPVGGDQRGLVDALEHRLAMVERRTGVKATLHVHGNVTATASQQEQIYWIAQEALNNVLRHSRASRVDVFVRARDGKVEVEIKDNGIGFDVDEAASRHGLGLANMRQRAEQLGGRLTVTSTRGVGTTVSISLD